jgi:hypothetical protein
MTGMTDTATTEMRELTSEELNFVAAAGAGVNIAIQNVNIASHYASLGGWIGPGG